MSIVELKVPAVGESITEVTLSQWLKEDGAYVEMDEIICEFDSDKATLEFPCEVSGKLIHVAKEDDDLEIGAVVAKVDTSVSAPSGKSEDKAEVQAAAAKPAANSKGSKVDVASPAAAKIMRESKMTAADVQGTGKDGRITKEDAVQASKSKPASGTSNAPMPARPTPSANSGQFSRETTEKKMSRMRRTIAKRLVSAKNSTAMLTTFNEVDLTEIIALRKKHQEQFVKKHGIKLGFMSLFSKACAAALMEMPDVNAQLDGDKLIYHDYVDISIAISTPNGLVVPPVKNVESLSLADIEKEIAYLAAKAREGDLTLDEMTGGTFTITNGGIFGSMLSTPILNEPQSAILGMHNIQQRPVAIDGEVKIRPMMYLALSYDHRVIDGSTSVTFLVKVKSFLEDPVTLLLDL